MSVSDELNTELQYHISGNYPVSNMIQENSIVKHFKLFTTISITTII